MKQPGKAPKRQLHEETKTVYAVIKVATLTGLMEEKYVVELTNFPFVISLVDAEVHLTHDPDGSEA